MIVHHHEVPNRNHPQVGRVLEVIEGDTVSLECNEPSSAGVRVSSNPRGRKIPIQVFCGFCTGWIFQLFSIFSHFPVKIH